MQEKRLKVWKRVTALLMSAILIAVSLPLALAADQPGSYNPTPTFAEDSTLWAWMTEEGTVRVSVPQATVSAVTETWSTQKSIARYIIRLYDLGPVTQHHLDPATDEVNTAEIIWNAGQIATLAEDGTFDVEFTAEMLENAQPEAITLNSTNRFNVEVYAQDSEGWVSSPISTLVSDVPRFEYTADSYVPVQENSTGMREVLMFEAANNDGASYVSSNGATAANQIGTRPTWPEDTGPEHHEGPGYDEWNAGALDYLTSSSTGTNQLDFRGQTLYGGEDGTGAYQFYVTGTGDQSFATTWSREHWDLTGAEEVWYWLDLSQVSVQGLAFELRTQGKRIVEEYYFNVVGSNGVSYVSTNGDNNYSPIVYSTKGTVNNTYASGEEPYVLVQQTDGSWEKVLLDNGTIDLANFKGYVRVPIQFICSTEATYAEVSNINFGTSGDWEDDNGASYVNSSMFAQPVQVDRAGTKIEDALLIQYRFFRFSEWDAFWNPNDYYHCYPSTNAEWGYSMLAVGDDAADAAGNNDGTKAYIDGNGQVANRDAGRMALEDIASAGFSYTSMSDDSVGHSFYLDSVMAYKTSGDYVQEPGMPQDIGQPLENYYDQSVEIPRSILTQIDELITTPDLGDYRAVQYISELLDAYREGYADFIAAEVAAGRSDFLSEDGMAAAAQQLGLSDVWNRFLEARQACVDAGTILYENGEYIFQGNNNSTDLVKDLAARLEKLPDASSVSVVTDAVANEITELYQIYRRLNLAQLDALSYAEEEKLLSYIRLVYGASISELPEVGDLLARNKFVTFNNFEENVSLGEVSALLENDPGGYGRRLDYRYTQGFLTYGITARDFMGTWDNYAVDDGNYRDPMQNGTMDTPSDLMENAVHGQITANGFNGTNAATVTINGAHYNGGNGGNGEYSILSVSRDSYTATGSDDVVWGDAVAHALGADVNLAAAAEGSTGNWSDAFPLGLIFYVDFSQLQNFKLTATITTNYHGDGSGPNDFILAMGDSGADKKFFLMDMESGTWVDVTSTGHGQNYFNSTTVGANGMKLDGYRGFIMIPLYQFKDNFNQNGAAVKLSECPQALNSIVRVSIGVAPINDAAASALTGQSFTVDNIGFGYAEAGYNTGSTVHPTFEEVFQVKSTAAQDFEESVAALEPMAEVSAANQAAIANLYTAYNALSDYQKSLESVQQAKEQLDLCNIYQTAANRPTVPSVDEFMAFVEALDERAKNAQTSGEDSDGTNLDLPYPGVLDLLDATGAAGQDGIADTPNYEAYGLTAELVDQIIEWRDDFNLYTADQRAVMNGLDTAYLNAYRAAQRCKMLETFIDQGEAFMGGLFGGENALYKTMSQIYSGKGNADLGKIDGTVYPYDANKPYGTWTDADGATVNEGYFVSISEANRSTLQSLYTTTFSDNMYYYAKDLLTTGQFVQVEGVEIDQIPTAVRNLLNNSDPAFQNGDVQAGLLGLQKKYTDLYSDASDKLQKGEFTATDRTNLLNAIDEYESLISTYHDVAELYDVIQQIYDLFPVVTGTWTAGTSGDAQTHNLLLTYDGEASSVTADTSAVYTLAKLESYLNDTTGTGTLTITSSNGGYLKDTAGNQLAYTLTNNGSEVTLTDGSATISSSTSTGSALATISATVSAPAQYTTALSDTVTLTYTYTYTDRNGIKREVEDVRYLVITYATEDFYTVTVDAEVEIPWGAETAYYNAEVSYNFSGDATLRVQGAATATADAYGNNLTMTNAGTTESISGSIGTMDSYYYGPDADSALPLHGTISIATDEWAGKPLGEYRATDAITYTVTYSDGSTTP